MLRFLDAVGSLAVGSECRSFQHTRNRDGEHVVIDRPVGDGIDLLRVNHGRRDYPALFGRRE